jgi:hypothetical protein
MRSDYSVIKENQISVHRTQYSLIAILNTYFINSIFASTRLSESRFLTFPHSIQIDSLHIPKKIQKEENEWLISKRPERKGAIGIFMSYT